MLLNCGVGEDSWESLGLQGDPTSPLWRRSALGFLWREWRWSWSSNTLPPDGKNWLIGKDPNAGKDWGQEKGMTEDEMVGWHHWHELEQALGDREGQGSLLCCSPWCCREWDMTEWLNNNNAITVKFCSTLEITCNVSKRKKKTPLNTPFTLCTSHIVMRLALGRVKAFAFFRSSQRLMLKADDHCSKKRANKWTPLK